MSTRAANTATISSTKLMVLPVAASHRKAWRPGASPRAGAATAESAVGRILGAATGHPAELRRSEGNRDGHGLSFHGGRSVGGEPGFKTQRCAGPLWDCHRRQACGGDVRVGRCAAGGGVGRKPGTDGEIW